MSRRWVPAAVVFGIVFAVAAGLAVKAASESPTFAFTLTVRAEKVAATITPGAEACQRQVETYAHFDELLLVYGTFHKRGPRLTLAVSDARTGQPLATGVRPAGYPDNTGTVAHLSRTVPAGRHIDICVRNTGPRRVAIYGAPDVDYYVNPSHAFLRRRPGAPFRITHNDLDINFFDSRPSTVLSRVPAIFRRATPFHPGWVGPWTFWALLGGLLLAAPALVALAIRASERDGAGDEA